MAHLLAKFGLQCGDPRDAVFALMGVTGVGLQVEIDYNKEVSDVYIEYYARALTSGHLQPPDFLEYTGIGLLNRADRPGLPSWVPDIHTLNPTDLLLGLRMKQNLACTGTSPPALKDLRTLRIRGLTFACVSSIVSIRTSTPGECLEGAEPGSESYKFSLAATFHNFARRYWQKHRSNLDFKPRGCVTSLMLAFYQLVVGDELAAGGEECKRDVAFLLDAGHFSPKTFWWRMENRFDLSKYLRKQSAASDELTTLLLDTVLALPADLIDETSEEYNWHYVNYVIGHIDYLYSRTVFETESGYFGLGPWFMKTGDRVCVLEDINSPFVLRKQDAVWKLVGSCYMPDVDDFVAKKTGGEAESLSEDLLEVFELR